jgi:cysteine-rich secretory family protein
MEYRPLTLPALVVVAATFGVPAAYADNDINTLGPNNKRFNDGVVANVFTMQHQAGCTNDVRPNPQLQQAAQWHTHDVLNNRNLDGDIGSDGSTPQDRANRAGFHGPVAETVAINPALAISGIELLNQWYYNPADFAIMSNCANSQVGVWSENSLDRTVVVAVYGQAEHPPEAPPTGPQTGPAPVVAMQPNIPPDPTPDYDASDEVEFGINWLPWILRGVYPPPGEPPQ